MRDEESSWYDPMFAGYTNAVEVPSVVTRIELDERTGLATGVRYVRAGRERFQRAKAIAVAGYAIDTPSGDLR